MDTIVLKFGGSSLADNEKLKTVANKIIEFHKRANKIVVVVSAQGKTTDKLIKEAYELSNIPDERELDVLLSSGEQMSMSKLAILLKQLGCDAISLTGWQAGIYTDSKSQESKILNIDTTRINQELEKNKIVIIAGFQGINENKDISTLGRGGSDTTAVAIAAAIKASHCYIFSDVDGVYSADPNKIPETKKIPELSYLEMVNLSDEGAKVLHNRCVEVGEKFNVPIIAKSTFNNNEGTIINNKIEGGYVKNIVKNDNIQYVHITADEYSLEKFNTIYNSFIEEELNVKNLVNSSENTLDISFTIPKAKFNKLANLLENKFPELESSYLDITRISIIGNGIMSNNIVLNKTMDVIKNNKLDIISMEINETKIAIMFKKIIANEVLEELHKTLI